MTSATSVHQCFERVVKHVFDNWTALQLVVEHSAAGANSKKVASEFMNYIVDYILYENTICADIIQDELDDYLDTNFNTICEDGSTKEIAELLHKFYEITLRGSAEEFEDEFNKLPVTVKGTSIASSIPVSTPPPESVSSNNDASQAESSSGNNSTSQVPMEAEDSEWIQVKIKNKRKRE